MKIRTIIVDDEALGRERLRRLLATEPGIEIIAECSDGTSAVETIQKEKPDLIFLDVQMPELDGFGVLESLPKTGQPYVIFVTAHDRFALKAFDVDAVDYLLKPFDRNRLSLAVARAAEKIESRAELLKVRQAQEESINAEQRKAKLPERIAVKSEGRVVLLKLEEIDWIEAADNYVSLHRGKEVHLHRETMSSIEERLADASFIRISRSAIVNINRIKELQPMFHGDYMVALQDGTKLTLSRTYRDKLNQLLGKLS
jgi:two-component system LytT family response regulator